MLTSISIEKLTVNLISRLREEIIRTNLRILFSAAFLLIITCTPSVFAAGTKAGIQELVDNPGDMVERE